MAPHFKVNGKFGRKPIGRLDDPERVRKDLESQSRITRLQQVRVASKDMAKTLRERVTAETERQIENLEAVRQKEVDAWRDNVLAKRHQDYRTAIFQVGGAHRAAREENELFERKRLEKNEKIKNCRKQAARRSLKPKANNVQLLSRTEMNLNPEGRATAGTQTPTMQAEDKENRLRGGFVKSGCKGQPQQDESKRKRCCDATSDEDESSSDDDSFILPNESPISNGRLQKTPPIIVDVDIEEDSLSETLNDGQGLEINDRFMQTNRKFSHVVRPNRDVSPERMENQRRPRFTQITDLVKRTETTVTSVRAEPSCLPEVAEPPSPTKSLSRSPTKTVIQVEAVSTMATKSTGSPKKSTLGSPKKSALGSPKKSTLGSPKKTNLGNPQKLSLGSRQQQPAKRVGLRTSPPRAKVIDPGILRNPKGKTTQAATLPKVIVAMQEPVPAAEPLENLRPIPQQANLPPQHMPVMPQAYPLPQTQPYIHIYPQATMQPYALPYSMPYPMPPHPMYAQQQPVHVPAATAPPSIATQSTVSTSTTTAMQQQGAKTVQAGGGRVQFYDHGNKYHRTYEASSQSVQCNDKDPSELNAMDHARIENQLRELREQELDKLRKITHNRGQKALEREQVRRDCVELTEKLDAMTQQDPNLLPSDANFIASHRYADVAARREQKMNQAMEQMLLRPAIITCPEVGTKSAATTAMRSKFSAPEAVNLGEYPRVQGNRNRNDLGSIESCCSILLDYADDQSKQLRSDIKAQKSNSLKSMRLRGLLDRIETVRGQLLEELKAGEDAESKGDKAQKLIDNIRQERADILAERTRSLNARESDLQQKEAILDQRLKDFYKDVKKTKKSSDGENGEAAKPLEIIIKVKSDGTVKQYVPRGKLKQKANVETMVNGREVPTASSDSTPREESGRPAPQEQRQNSFDSNSTAYRSLPPVSYKSFNPTKVSPCAAPSLHPLIAHYIDRLLAMNPENMHYICESSSDLTTPSQSIVNTSENLAPEPDKAYASIVNAQRMRRVETFIAENRSFVNDLEDSIRCQQQLEREQQQAQDMESSIRNFDKIWNKRLAAKKKEDCNKKPQERERQDGSRSRPQEVNKRVTPQDGRKAEKQKTETQVQYEKVTTSVGPQSSSGKSAVTVTQKSKTKSTSETSSTRQMDRFEVLTENCTARIAELTDLITKVREEKQRLVEVTLTSNSDGERQSTEYFELPTGQKQPTRNRTLSERSDSQTASLSEGLPLQKNKPTAASRDSGIADSRPLTAQGHVHVDTEPVSLISSTQSNGMRNRSKAPPATIRRYSPQLDEEDLGHELSTITEVETPGQSHIIPATPVPRPFPNFDQYARELRLDMSTVGADESQQLQADFNDLMQVVHQRVGADYREFPSINAYLHNITTTNVHVEADGDDEDDQGTLETANLIRQLRVVNMKIREFPKRRDYLQKLVEQYPADERVLIDSASLERDSSDSLDVEQELRQRRILRSSFRRGNMTETTLTAHEVASSTRRESVARAANEAPHESGIDPLSGSNYSSDVEQRAPWHATAHKSRNRSGGRESSSTASTSPERMPRRQSRVRGGHRSHDEADDMQDVSQLGKSLNIREFLTRELLKHRVQPAEASAESSDESLRGHFLKSVLHTFSPNSTATLTPAVGVSHATGATNDRQKTSTPVGSFVSLANKSGSVQSTGTALFSGESRLSLVHYPDGTPPIPYEQQSKQSTNYNPSPMMSGGKKAHRKSTRK